MSRHLIADLVSAALHQTGTVALVVTVYLLAPVVGPDHAILAGAIAAYLAGVGSAVARRAIKPPFPPSSPAPE